MVVQMVQKSRKRFVTTYLVAFIKQKATQFLPLQKWGDSTDLRSF